MKMKLILTMMSAVILIPSLLYARSYTPVTDVSVDGRFKTVNGFSDICSCDPFMEEKLKSSLISKCQKEHETSQIVLTDWFLYTSQRTCYGSLSARCIRKPVKGSKGETVIARGGTFEGPAFPYNQCSCGVQSMRCRDNKGLSIKLAKKECPGIYKQVKKDARDSVMEEMKDNCRARGGILSKAVNDTVVLTTCTLNQDQWEMPYIVCTAHGTGTCVNKK